MKFFYFVVLIFFLLSPQVFANNISGFASITPEKKQKCIKNLQEYNCGKVATNALIQKIDGRQVICKVQNKLDRYKRYIGICFVEKINLNKWLVRNGYAVAYRKYSKNYIDDEEYAKKKKLGMWSGTFIQPEKWRKLN